MNKNAQYIIGIDFNFKRCRAWGMSVLAGGGRALPLYDNYVNPHDSLELDITNDFISSNLNRSLRHISQDEIYSFLISNPLCYSGYCNVLEDIVERLQSCNSVLKELSCEWCFYLPPFWDSTLERRFYFINLIGTGLSKTGIEVKRFVPYLKAIEGFLGNYGDGMIKSSSTLFIYYGANTIEVSKWENGMMIQTFTSELGASLIEKLIFEYYRLNDSNYNYAYDGTERVLRETGNEYYNIGSTVLYRIKKSKEEMFRNGNYPHYILNFNWGTFTGLVGKNNPFRPYSFEFYIDDVQPIIQPYMDKVNEFFHKVKDLTSDIDLIFCTGKASSMSWVNSSLLKIFKKSSIYIDRSPSHFFAKCSADYVRSIIRKSI